MKLQKPQKNCKDAEHVLEEYYVHTCRKIFEWTHFFHKFCSMLLLLKRAFTMLDEWAWTMRRGVTAVPLHHSRPLRDQVHGPVCKINSKPQSQSIAESSCLRTFVW